MKKLTTFTASVLLGFGLVSCKGDKDGASTDDKKSPEKEASASTGEEATGEEAQTVSLKVSGMT